MAYINGQEVLFSGAVHITPAEVKASEVSESVGGGLIPRRDENGNINAPDADKHPPTDDQYVSKRFADKKYVPSPTPDSEFLSLIGIGNDGKYYTKKSTPSSAIGGHIPIRNDGGQIVAPNQADKKPELDEYISRRYLELQAADVQKHLEDNYLKIRENRTVYTALYAQIAKKDGGGQTSFGISTGANAGTVPVRDGLGQLNAPLQVANPDRPNDTVFEPRLDQYISRRYLEAKAPSGGSKLYRHDISISDWEGGTWDYIAHFTLYTHSAEEYESASDLPIRDDCRYSCWGKLGNDQGVDLAIYGRFHRDSRDGYIHLVGATLRSLGNLGLCGWYTIVPNAGEAYSFIDCVTEVT